ncbi:TetR/AcrR family transcriptional regulator [Dactylosporangium sucinum]|uniref:TetR family transcriptional regulator n=1 Tax=Dactylosporangium sucinum TaxID=1424081 RepID=A0A917UEF3_9ACTN|nr:TetR/AcrR family transcriptional regulator [Dactylosporangium sucinum]GGM82363.1 TetR family transcriptional regulator [Dactylosporangium sucinum]
MTTLPPTRRERVRAATLDEILQVARRLLVQETIAGVTLRAIARDMGMTAAALYRYYPSLESLVAGLCARLYEECTTEIAEARDLAGSDPGARLYAMCRTFRAWSVTHPAEFNLMFASPVPEAGRLKSGEFGAGLRFALTFADIFGELWERAPFPVPPEEELPPLLAEQLHQFIDELGQQGARQGTSSLPVGAAQLYLSCWVRMYGIVALEVYGHLKFALSDVGPMFDAELDAAARQLGLDPARYRDRPL